jgi:alkanesulfonate monooxygenase SsuD/methylene tetrahydromethanopterin reductase-like flavin-dependent oxidoreductase (luciferase family)
MDLGVAPPTFATDGWRLPASRLLRFAERAEALDFAGVWVTEHLRHPPNRNYSRLAPMTTLATVAGATESIPIGTSVLILPLRDPVLVAQRAATLQHLSEERLLHHADGWLAPPKPPSVLAADWEDIADHLEREGRDPSTLDRVALSWLHLVPDVDGDLAREKQRRVFTERRGADDARARRGRTAAGALGGPVAVIGGSSLRRRTHPNGGTPREISAASTRCGRRYP